MLKRKVWPILAWTSGVLFVTLLGLIYTVSFVDDRWVGFLFVNIIMVIASLAFMGGTHEDETTYEVKPRGWRKERRRAEKEAYVRQLEQELLDD